MLASNWLTDYWDFLQNRYPDILKAAEEHALISVLAIALGVAVAVPTGIWLSRRKTGWPHSVIFTVANVFQTIPSLALLALLIPLFGIGMKPAVIALLLYSLLPILRNTVAGFRSVDPGVIEAARGMGYGAVQRLLRIELPLAFPYVMSGIRTTTVYIISWTTLAALIGAGGLGQLIVSGLGVNRQELIVTGALSAIAFALVADFALAMLEKTVALKTRSSARSSAA